MQSSHESFTDRRSEDEVLGQLATPILFWRDTDKKGRVRTNGVAITTAGELIKATAVCSKRDQFVKSHGRMVVTQRIIGRAKRHCWVLYVHGVTGTSYDADDKNNLRFLIAKTYEDVFPDDECGRKRAYNAANIYRDYLASIERRANELLDDF